MQLLVINQLLIRLGYNKQSISSSESAERASRRLSDNHTKSKDSLHARFNSIKEVDESISDYETTEKTIQMSALANYGSD